ncbi:MAG TPA: hypothetical protein VJH33_03675 [Candidatus Paceibacterota bacterium]
MSDIKDTQKTNALSSFLDVQLIKTSPFLNNTSGERAYVRAERIVAAIFLLTNHFNYTDQIRESLRGKGMGLLSSILGLRSGLRSSGADLVQSVQATVRELISLMRMSAVAGYISTQNASEVIQALDDLGSLLVASQRSDLSESVVLRREDLIPKIPEINQPLQQKERVNAIEGQEKIISPIQTAETKTEILLQNKEKDLQKTESKISYRTQSTKARSQEVMEILKLNGRLGIKDIYSNMPECSEKMIQRELALLVSKGQVKKFGAKRWSLYELVK